MRKKQKPEISQGVPEKNLVVKKISPTRCENTGCKIIPEYNVDGKNFCEKHFKEYTDGRKFRVSSIESPHYPGITSHSVIDGTGKAFANFRDWQKTQKPREEKYFDDRVGKKTRQAKYIVTIANAKNIPVCDFKFPGDSYNYKSISYNGEIYIYTDRMTPIMIIGKNNERIRC